MFPFSFFLFTPFSSFCFFFCVYFFLSNFFFFSWALSSLSCAHDRWGALLFFLLHSPSPFFFLFFFFSSFFVPFFIPLPLILLSTGCSKYGTQGQPRQTASTLPFVSPTPLLFFFPFLFPLCSLFPHFFPSRRSLWQQEASAIYKQNSHGSCIFFSHLLFSLSLLNLRNSVFAFGGPDPLRVFSTIFMRPPGHLGDWACFEQNLHFNRNLSVLIKRPCTPNCLSFSV